MKRDIWKEYFKRTRNIPPRPLLVKALTHVKNRDVAIDLGGGALNDSIYLVQEGFRKVIAVDKKPIAKAIADTLPPDQFQYVISPFESFEFPSNAFDLANAQYSLPFILPDAFESVLGKIAASLKDGGIFTGQFFGDRDEWSSNGNMTFVSQEEVMDLLSAFEILSFEEEEREKPTAMGEMKHWHIFHFIVKKEG